MSSAAPGVSRTKDVGGWLLFFCVMTSIVSPVLGVVSILRDIVEPNWADLLTLVLAGFSAFVGGNVWLASKWAFTLLRIYFVLFTALSLFVLTLAAIVWQSGEEVPTAPITTGLKVTLWVLIWWPYFNMSRRVKETFGRNLKVFGSDNPT